MEGGRIPAARFVRTVTVGAAVHQPFVANPTDFSGGTDNAQNPVLLVLTAETNPVRLTENGTDPSATLGIFIPASGQWLCEGWDNIKRLKLFRAAGADSTVNYQVYF